jgi:hypothetical protein
VNTWAVEVGLSMHRSIHTISNSDDSPLVVWLEPWAEKIQLAPGSLAEFVAESESESEGALEVSEGTPITVFGWPGASLRVEVNGQVVWESYALVPALAPGMTVRRFLGILGLGKEGE